MPIRSATLPGKISLKIPKPVRKYRFWLDLPRDSCSRLQNGQRCGREQIAEIESGWPYSVVDSHHARWN